MDEPERHICITWQMKNLQRITGIAWVDVDRKEIGIGEFLDTKQYTNLETAILQSVSGDPTILMQHGEDYEAQKVKQVLVRCGLTGRELKSALMKTKETYEELCHLVGGDKCASAISEQKMGLYALQLLLSKFTVSVPLNSDTLFSLIQINTGTHLQLDASATYALGIFDAGADGPKTMTIFGLLNQCSTKMGERKLRQWLKQPSADLEEIESRHDIVEIFVRNTQMRQAVQQQYLHFFSDVEKIALRFSRGKGTLEDTVHLYQSVQLIPGLCEAMRVLVDAMAPPIPVLIESSSSDPSSGRTSLSVASALASAPLRDEKWALSELACHFIDPLLTVNEHFKLFLGLVESVIDLKKVDSDNMYLVKAEFDPSLLAIAQKRDETLEKIKRLHQQAVRELLGEEIDEQKSTGRAKKGGKGGRNASSPWERVKLEQNPQQGFYLKMSKNDEKMIRGRGKTYTWLETHKDGVRFTFSGLRAASTLYTELTKKYEEKQRELELRTLDIVASYTTAMEDLGTILSTLDVLCAFGQISCTAPTPFVRPIMEEKGTLRRAEVEKKRRQQMLLDKKDATAEGKADDEDEVNYDEIRERDGSSDGWIGGVIEIRGMRHPCLEVQEGVNFIPNDCYLVSGAWDERSKAAQSQPETASTTNPVTPSKDNIVPSYLLVTGPNMGGKSTYIRSVGIVVLLAQIGCFVPCTFCRLSVRDRILARVGSGDFLFGGFSTFMAEMLETASILSSATEDSLVIIDELGRGTSTYDGLGLAWSISETIAKTIGSPTLFATHFHELTALSKELPSVGNCHASVLQSEGVLTFLFKIEDGPCERSFGIHVAEMAGFPPHVIELAEKKLAEFESESRDFSVTAPEPSISNSPLSLLSPASSSSSTPLPTSFSAVTPSTSATTKSNIESVIDALASVDTNSLTTEQALELVSTLA
ncbi:DNA mismatch repair protein Msh2 [Monocercomonoides exilis]|uniref:DNA mismatch repair protein Msh2 n=1 Tax=Monocercomonoides exilis TaxID=2049356 RepID=UPI00355AA16B|nr:DNA mismatch repair protein Msh2 [Monocercomonoides exilis]|eukprot:MONOS_1208.1-p1 / transcript=MONOS_1208.1 / gene=MONOS_1208 / organism=Monocercomonoides_exilis_PA203 / gene_product=DNA mismatch repair protein Msh2 / transcript_product=DNA mismatch repair protein Msh2 / location=Mono_scaffold00020:176309-179542(-) / protein_length=931 / sequence_SO=supercontig / SO=protein_coding / is_pseudo=false